MNLLIEINEEKLTKVLKQELHENNKKKIKEILNKNSIKLNFYLRCENCNNTVSAYSHNKKWSCGEHCNGCKRVICYECTPYNDRYCKVNLDNKKIEVRDNNDKRFNMMITVDDIKKHGSDYCESCAFDNLKNGLCMIKVKQWEERNQPVFEKPKEIVVQKEVKEKYILVVGNVPIISDPEFYEDHIIELSSVNVNDVYTPFSNGKSRGFIVLELYDISSRIDNFIVLVNNSKLDKTHNLSVFKFEECEIMAELEIMNLSFEQKIDKLYAMGYHFN